MKVKEAYIQQHQFGSALGIYDKQNMGFVFMNSEGAHDLDEGDKPERCNYQVGGSTEELLSFGAQ